MSFANNRPFGAFRGGVAMSGLKGLRHLDYAVYGNLIVPMLMFEATTLFNIFDDQDAGRCRIESRQRKRK